MAKYGNRFEAFYNANKGERIHFIMQNMGTDQFYISKFLTNPTSRTAGDSFTCLAKKKLPQFFAFTFRNWTVDGFQSIVDPGLSHIKPVGTLTNFKDEFSDRNEITIWWLKPIYMNEIFSFPPPIHCFLTLTNCTGAFCHMPCQFEIHHPWFLYVLQNRPKRHALPIIARWVLTLRDPSWLLETQNWQIWDGSNFYGLDFTEWMLGMWTGDIDSYLDNHFLYGIGLFKMNVWDLWRLTIWDIKDIDSPLDPAVTR